MKLISVERYRAGARAKRLYGSSTATIFAVETPGRPDFYVEAYGPTPGARKTIARKAAKVVIQNGTWDRYNSSRNPIKAFPEVS